MKGLGLLSLAVGALLVSSAPLAFGYSGAPLSLTVYSDGYAHVSQAFSVDPNATSVRLPLLSSAVSDLVATDQDGSPLSYGFSPSGGGITVYTLGASSVTLKYDTSALTSKNGSVWTLYFSASSNSTLTLPPDSTLLSASGNPNPTPYSIGEVGSSPTLSLPPGAWEVGYGVPFSGSPATSSTSSTGTTSQGGTSQQEAEGTAVVLMGALVVALALLWRRRGRVPDTAGLRPDDVQVLSFIRENGGKVLEPEIRMKFALPKTSAWRQIKRLERMGYVRVTKIGSQNQVELLKERSEG